MVSYQENALEMQCVVNECKGWEFYYVFVDLEKAYDLREELWYWTKKSGVAEEIEVPGSTMLGVGITWYLNWSDCTSTWLDKSDIIPLHYVHIYLL